MANPNPNQSLVKYDNAILVSTTKDKKGKKGKTGGKEQVSVFFATPKRQRRWRSASNKCCTPFRYMALRRPSPPLTASQRRRRTF